MRNTGRHAPGRRERERRDERAGDREPDFREGARFREGAGCDRHDERCRDGRFRHDESYRRDERDRCYERHRYDERYRHIESYRCEESYRHCESYRYDERYRRNERADCRERSHSRERGHQSRRWVSPERFPPSTRPDRNLARGCMHRSAGASSQRRSPPRNWRTAPPPPPPGGAGTCAMPTMSPPRGRATSAGALRPNAAALDPRHLTVELGKARALPELLSMQRRHGDQFNRVHLSAFWSKFKALARGELGGLRDRLAPVCEQTVQMLPELDARQVSNIAHAFAKAGLVGTGPCQNVYIYIYI